MLINAFFSLVFTRHATNVSRSFRVHQKRTPVERNHVQLQIFWSNAIPDKTRKKRTSDARNIHTYNTGGTHNAAERNTRDTQENECIYIYSVCTDTRAALTDYASESAFYVGLESGSDTKSLFTTSHRCGIEDRFALARTRRSLQSSVRF